MASDPSMRASAPCRPAMTAACVKHHLPGESVAESREDIIHATIDTVVLAVAREDGCGRKQ